jgi:2-octaprenyl-6-methoxyphenol hydroxylase
VFDSRPAERDMAADPRTIAVSLGSVRELQRLGCWRGELAQAIAEVHVSQQPPSSGALLGAWLGEPEVRIRAVDEAVPMLGAVLSYGAIVAPLQQTWLQAERDDPGRLHSRFGTPVVALKNIDAGVEVDAAIAERFDLAVVAEGGVFAEQGRKAVHHDYRQVAWVGRVEIDGGAPGVAFERFTRHGPAALLPLRDGGAALVWCVGSDDDPVLNLDDTQRVAVLNSVFHASVGRIRSVSALKRFPLGLNAERTLTDGRIVRIGNAAQTLHPVAGQGMNLGLRDASALVRALTHQADVGAALRSLEWQRAPDRWSMIAATDFLARSFTWALPGAGTARGLGMHALQALAPVKSALARHMMFGSG